MSKFGVGSWWGADIDLEYLCRNFTQDKEDTQRRMVNSGGTLAMLARKQNFLLARHMRTVFQRAHSEADLLTTTAATQILHSGRFSDFVDNEIDYAVRILAVNRENGTNNSTVAYRSELSGAYNNTVATASYPEDLFLVQLEKNRGAPTDGFVNQDLEVDNGFIVVDCIVQGKTLDILDTDDHLYVSPYLAVKGQPILADVNEQLRNAIHKTRTENLPIVGEWYANKTAAGWATPAAPGDSTAMATDSTTYVNAMAESVTTRTATSQGIYCPVNYMGLGPIASTEGATVKAKFSVLATATTADGKVAIEGPNAPATETTITAGAGPTWHDAAGYILLNTASGYALSTTARNKVDIFIKSGISGTLHVYGIVIYLAAEGT